MEKSKAEKSPWVKKKKKKPPNEGRKSSILSSKEKENLAKSDKGFWFGQTPLTSSASAEDPKLLNTLGADVYKTWTGVHGPPNVPGPWTQSMDHPRNHP